MAKGWTKVETIYDTEKKTREESIRDDKKWNKLIKGTKIRTIEQMKKDADKSYEEQVAADDNLIQSFDDKKLKSKQMIKQAIRIKKIREQAEAKKKEEKKEA